jgi:hypothetical protein
MSPALVGLGKVLWTKAGSSISQAVRLRVVVGEHEGNPCLDLVIDNCTGHNVYNLSIKEIPNSPGQLSQLPDPLVTLLTAQGIGVVPPDGLCYCLGPVSRYASPVGAIMVVASWLNRSPLTESGSKREQKPEDFVSVIDLYAVARQGSPGAVLGQGMAIANAIMPISGTQPSPAVQNGSTAQLPTP